MEIRMEISQAMLIGRFDGRLGCKENTMQWVGAMTKSRF